MQFPGEKIIHCLEIKLKYDCKWLQVILNLSFHTLLNIQPGAGVMEGKESYFYVPIFILHLAGICLYHILFYIPYFMLQLVAIWLYIFFYQMLQLQG